MQTVLALLLKYRYAVLFPLAAFEGPVVSLLVGFLVYSKVFNFEIAYIILLFGDIIPDSILYCVGYFGHQTGFMQRRLLAADFFKNHFTIFRKLWVDHPMKTMFFGKLAYGMAMPFLISAGITKMTYKKFMSLTIPVTLFQYGVLMGIGYYLGNSYAVAIKYVDYAYFILALLVLFFIAGYALVVRYARKQVRKMEKEEEINTTPR